MMISDQDILTSVIEGNVISVEEALSLVKSAKLEDLLLAADLLRRRIFREGVISVRQTLDEKETIKENNLPKRFKLCPSRFSSVKQYEELFSSLNGLPIEFSDIEGLLIAAKRTTYASLAKRCARAGLHAVFVEDDALLMSSKYKELWSALHAVGIRTAFKLKLGSSWEASLSKLAKLRQLQKKSFGISYIEVPAPQDLDSIRFVCLARLFLDNIPCITVSFESRNLQSELALIAGVSEIVLDK